MNLIEELSLLTYCASCKKDRKIKVRRGKYFIYKFCNVEIILSTGSSRKIIIKNNGQFKIEVGAYVEHNNIFLEFVCDHYLTAVSLEFNKDLCTLIHKWDLIYLDEETHLVKYIQDRKCFIEKYYSESQEIIDLNIPFDYSNKIKNKYKKLKLFE